MKDSLYEDGTSHIRKASKLEMPFVKFSVGADTYRIPSLVIYVER